MARHHIVIDTPEVDRATTERFRDEIQLALQSLGEQSADGDDRGTGVGTLVVDLRGVSFIDSSGLRVLVETQQMIRARGGQLEVLVQQGAVRRTLEVSGVWDHLNGNGSADGHHADGVPDDGLDPTERGSETQP
jgi:anti-sigma B factor antagonist